MRARSRQGADSSAPQGGFVLVMVLGIIGLTAVVVVALLGLALTSARVTAAQRETAREQRAAANALEVAVGQLGQSADDEPCDAVPKPANLTFEAEGSAPGVPVTVGCDWMPWAAPSSSPPPSNQLEPNDPTPRTPFPKIDLSQCLGCTATRSFETQWTSPGSDELRSAYLLFQSDEGENVHNLNRTLAVDVTSGPAGARSTCRVNVSGGRLNEWAGAFTAVDLFGSDACRAQLSGKPRSVFDGATISVDHIFDQGGGACPLSVPEFCRAELAVGATRLLLNVDVLEAALVPSPGTWVRSEAVRSLGGSSTHVNQFACFPDDDRCRKEIPGQAFGISLENFVPAGTAAPDPDDPVDTLGVLLDSHASISTRSWISDVIDGTSFQLQLTANGKTCEVTHQGYARSRQKLYVDLFGGSTCRSVVQNVGDLKAATLTYTVHSGCAHFSNGQQTPIDENGRCDSVRLPDFDRIALAVTTPPEPISSLVTLTAHVHGRVAPAAQAEVYLDGTTTLPRPTPVIGWRYCAQGTCVAEPDAEVDEDVLGTSTIPGP